MRDAAREQILRITVLGTPRPQGSKRVVQPKGQRARLLDDTRDSLRTWRSDVVAEAARHRSPGQSPHDEPVVLSCVFSFRRPRSHYTSTGRLKAGAPAEHTQKPDVDKLLRAIGDALVDAGVLRDDSRIVEIRGRKVWAETASATIAVEALQRNPHPPTFVCLRGV